VVVDWKCLLCASCAVMEARNCCEEDGRELGDNVKVVENKESRELRGRIEESHMFCVLGT
jgi:hypothetical protein